MSFDYNKLRGKIREVFGTETAFADKLNMARGTLSFKLNGKTEWTQQEMLSVIELLGEPKSAIDIYFFTKKS